MIRWAADVDGALAAARARGTLALVHFHDPARPLSRAMEQETLLRPEVAAAAASFVAVRADATAHADLFDRLIGGSGALASCLVDVTGDVVAALLGYAPPEAYVEFLLRAAAAYPWIAAARARVGTRPRDPGALLALAQAYETAGSARRAEETWTRLIQVGARSAAAATAHERLARAAVLRGRNQEARAHLQAYRRLDPRDVAGRADRATFTEGLVLALERRLADSRTAIEAALRAPAERDHRLYTLGCLQHELRDDATAIETLERVRREHPRSPFHAAAGQRIAHIRNPGHDH